MLAFLKLPGSDRRQMLDLSYARPDYEPTIGLGSDRDTLPDPVRLIVYLRSLGRCAYCCRPLVFTFRQTQKHFTIHGKVASRMFQLDHVLPVSVGGREWIADGVADYRNFQPLCEYHNGFKFKAALIELHGAFQAARLGQTTAVHDWRVMYAAWQAAWAKGELIVALPFWWYEKNPRGGLPTLKLPGIDAAGEIDRPRSWQIEKGIFDRNLDDFLKQERFGKIKAMILPELVNHDRAYL